MNEKLTAYALNELPPDERAALEAQMQRDPALAAQAAELEEFCHLLGEHIAPDNESLTNEQRLSLIKTFKATPAPANVVRPWRKLLVLSTTALAACLALMLVKNHDLQPETSTDLIAEAQSSARTQERSERVTVTAAKPDAPAKAAPVDESLAKKKEAPVPAALAAATPTPEMKEMKALRDNDASRFNNMPATTPKIVSAPAAPMAPAAAAPARPLPRPAESPAPAKGLAEAGKNAPTLTMGSMIVDHGAFKGPLSTDDVSQLTGHEALAVSNAATPPLAGVNSAMTNNLGSDSTLTIQGGTGGIILSPSDPKASVSLELGNVSLDSTPASSMAIGGAPLPWAITEGAVSGGFQTFTGRLIGGGTTAYESGANAATLDMSGRLADNSRADASKTMSFGNLAPKPAGKDLPLGELTVSAGSNVTLSGTSTFSGGVTLNAGVPSYDTPSTPPSNQSTDMSLTGGISGSGGMVKAGDGTLILNGSNTYSGGTIVNGGILSTVPQTAANSSVMSSGSQTINALPMGSGGSLSRSAGAEVNFNNSGAITANSGNLTPGATATAMAQPTTATIGTLTVVGGTTLTKSGGGTLTLGASSTADKAMLADSGASVASGATLNMSGSGSVTFGGTIATGSISTTTGGISATQSSGNAMNPPPAARAGKLVGAVPQDAAKAKSASPIPPQSVDGLIVNNGTATRTRMQNAVSDKWEEKPAPGLIIKDAAGREGENRLSTIAPTTPAPAPTGTQAYRPIIENPFTYVAQEPLSTFSTDVDTASYANIRRFLNHGQRPPADAVRLEELINYFPYSYEPPADDKPFAVHVDVAEAPWQPLHRLARIALKAREVHDERRAANFVFLLDVSGSMSPPERLPLIKQGLRLLVEQLREDDHVAIVTYAGESGVALESTSAAEKERIMQVIDKLKAGGSTNGASGIRLAYEQAGRNFHKDHINRVILATDGDFNVGASSVNELEALIAEEAKSGVFLSVLGVGTDNLKDHTMQTLADRGNGNYHYLDSLSEARKVLVDQMTGTLVTVAKDVKIQVEFNPAQVAAYRLIGYEKRMLAKQDFNNDKKDAGEIGAGHTITALYEIVPASLKYPDGKPLVDDLKYAPKPTAPAEPQSAIQNPKSAIELMTVKLRYKAPDGDKSQLMEQPVTDAGKKLSEGAKDFQFAVSVAGFGMLLRDSQQRGDLNWELVRSLAQKGKGDDANGYRGEFLQLIDKARGVCEPK